MTITHRVAAKSKNFSYEGYGSSKQEASDALLAGLRKHSEELDTAPEFPAEMMAESHAEEIATGRSRFCAFDEHEAHEVARTGLSADISWRAFCEMKSRHLDWGYVDGYGSTEDEAREIMMAGVDAMLADGSTTSLSRDQILEDAETYQVRAGGAYRGGMIQSLGEPLLDDHIPPTLPAHSTDWLHTVRCRLELRDGAMTVASAEATARPNRHNQMPVTTFYEEDLADAVVRLSAAIASPDIRAAVNRQIGTHIPDMIVDALLSNRGETMRREVPISDRMLLVIAFDPRPTTAESLVAPKD